MKKNLYFIIFLLMMYQMPSYAQNIDISLSKHGGEEYTLVLWKGLTADTVASGILNANGTFRIVIPEWNNDYKGMANFRLSKGGGVDFILSGKDLGISSNAVDLNINNVIITNSDDNDMLVREFGKMQRLNQQSQLLPALTNTYVPTDPFSKSLSQELDKVLIAKKNYYSYLATSPLYAARFLQINKYLEDILLAYVKSPAEIESLRVYGRDSLDVKALYTSSLWYNVVDYWSALYRNKYVSQAEKAFGEDGIKILSRIEDQEIFEEFAINLINISEITNWPTTTLAIADYIASTGRVKNHSRNDLQNVLRITQTSSGKKAPLLTLDNGQEVEIESLNEGANSFLLIFYETSCGHCEEELRILSQQYENLKAKGVEIVSVSLDSSKEMFDILAPNFPWKNRLCDFKALQGDNFQKFGIIGTPTIYHIDKGGIIQGRHAKVKDIGLI